MNMKKNKLLDNIKSLDFLSILIAYIIVIAVFAPSSRHFLTIRNFLNIGQYAAVIGTMATSMTLVIVSGNIDISLGSIVALSGMFVASFTPADPGNIGGLLFAMFLGVLTGAACGLVNGFFVTRIKVNAFITSMATMNIFRGLGYILYKGKSITVTNPGLGIIGRGRLFGVFPNTLIVLAIAVALFWFIARYTVFGRRMFIIGGNPTAAFLSGIKVDNSILCIFIINGAMTGLAGVMTTSQLGAALPQGSAGLEFQVISAIILGGASLSGGKGSMLGSLFGVLLLATLNNGMVMMNIPAYWQLVVMGVVLILAVSIDVFKTRRFSLQK
jgi:ribose/xylose/arabinose/galactoside ABC-type transport system permease subunit